MDYIFYRNKHGDKSRYISSKIQKILVQKTEKKLPKNDENGEKCHVKMKNDIKKYVWRKRFKIL